MEAIETVRVNKGDAVAFYNYLDEGSAQLDSLSRDASLEIQQQTTDDNNTAGWWDWRKWLLGMGVTKSRNLFSSASIFLKLLVT